MNLDEDLLKRDFGDKSHLTTDELINGKPAGFDLAKYLEVVDQMCSCDEVLTALDMLNKLPAWYRENEPSTVTELRRFIENKIYLPAQYAVHDFETYKDASEFEMKYNPLLEGLEHKIDMQFCQPRGHLAVQLIQTLNKNGQIPHIVEFGPSDYWLPLGLKRYGCKFTYYGYSLNKAAESQIKSHLDGYWMSPGNEPKDATYVYVCCEVVEHLMNVDEVKLYSTKLGRGPDHVIFSCPHNSYFGGKPKWRDFDVEHIRTFTTKEFIDLAKRFWPNLTWELFLAPSQVLWGKRV